YPFFSRLAKLACMWQHGRFACWVETHVKAPERDCTMSAFPEIQKIRYEGPDSKNPLAFRHYNEDEIVEGVSMKDHLRFSVVYWHTFRGAGSDPFGPGTAVRPWEDGTDSVENAINRARVA